MQLYLYASIKDLVFQSINYEFNSIILMLCNNKYSGQNDILCRGCKNSVFFCKNLSKLNNSQTNSQAHALHHPLGDAAEYFYELFSLEGK